MTRDLAAVAVFSLEEDCSCSCSGFYRQEWEALKRLREADGVERNQVTMADDIDEIIGASRKRNETTGGTIDKGAV